MAVIIQPYSTSTPNGYLSGTQMCGSPVIVSFLVDAGTFTAPAGAITSMHKAWVRVSEVDASYKPIEGRHRDISFSAEENEHFTVDISGALRSLIADMVYDPNDGLSAIQYPVLRYSVAGGHSYMMNGVVNTFMGTYIQKPMFAVHGRLTERERLTIGHQGITSNGAYLLSSKPSEVEETAAGCTPFVTAITGGSYSEAVPTSTPPSLIPSPKPQDLSPDTQSPRPTYTDPLQTGYAEFCFVNRLGGIETVCVRTLEALTVDVKSDVYSRVSAPTRLPKLHDNAFVHQNDIYDRYAMSSGPVSRAWSQWWAREFLTASAWWVRLTPGTGTWIPCTVSPAPNKVSIYNRASSDALHVDFDVTLTLT